MNKIAFISMHVILLSIFWINIHWTAWLVAFLLYGIRMFAITAGYHRYFSHKTFQTNRFFQFILAFIAQSSGQKGVLWWASNHRIHHQKSDTAEDIHSPIHKGFWYSHLGWWFGSDHKKTHYKLIEDFAKYPELRWLNRYFLIPPILLGATCLWLGGLDMLIVGFFFSTVVLYHATFTINSLSHIYGSQRYNTHDQSRNNWFLAILTLGEGWHNNHHFYPRSCRQGFFWWEYDITFYILKLLSFVGIVSHIRNVPLLKINSFKDPQS